MAEASPTPTTDRPRVGPGRLPPTDDGRMRFTRDDYHRLAEIGVLTESDRVELLDGVIYNKWPAGPEDQERRFTRDEYDRMIEAGFLTKEDRVELLSGEILVMSPIEPIQSNVITRLAEFFIKSISGGLVCRVQLPIALDDVGEPEPDIVVARRKADEYRDSHPEVGDIVLVIEVSESSLRFDRGKKMRDYAHAGIPEYWIADVNRDAMIVHSDPDPDGGEYRNVQQFGTDSKIAPQAIPDCELDLGWLFR